jgi:hypothetical protein
MTDKELLKLAAKAARQGYLHIDGMRAILHTNSPAYWNPLTDDGDALRLAARLEMCLDFMDRRVIAGQDMPDVVCNFEDGDYKRAIVCAAAEIGKCSTS